MVYNLLMNYWTQFASILLKMFATMYTLKKGGGEKAQVNKIRNGKKKKLLVTPQKYKDHMRLL